MPDLKSKDEIDLMDLFLKAINTVRSYSLLIIIFFIIGSALGLAYFLSSKKVYESKMIVSSGILTESYTKILFDNATRHLREGNTGIIAKQFNISEKAAEEVISLKIETLAKSEPTNQKENDRFLITVEVFDLQILPELQRGLIDYLENNDFVKIRVEQSRSYLKQMLSSVEKEILDMEQFKLKIINGEFFQSAKGNIMFDPTTVNSKILELKERKISLENSLQLSNSVQVIEDFTRFEKQISPLLSISLVSGSLVGLFFVVILIAIKSLQKLLTMADTAK